MKKYKIIIYFLIFSLITFFLFSEKMSVHAQNVSPIPQTILNGLRAGGTALVFDWWDFQHYNPTAFNDDLPIIKANGGGHVRLTMSMNTIEQGTSGTVNTSRWNDVKNFVSIAKQNGLVTIIDVHDTGLFGTSTSGEWTNDYMVNLNSASMRTRHISLLSDIAARMNSDLDLNWVVLQPANEPIFDSGNQSIWYNHQNQLIPAIRTACHECVVFAMAHEWQGVEATVYNLNPSSLSWWDARVIPDIHFYDPLELTHCAYPGSPNNCPGKSWPGTYNDWDGSHYYNKAFLESKLAMLWTWKQQYNIPIIHFSEIGTAAALADATKGPYLKDLTDILQAHGASWSCWEWDKNFGMYPNHPQAMAACLRGTSNPVPTSTPGGTNPTPTRTPTPQPTTGAGTPTPTISSIPSGPLTIIQPLSLSTSSVQSGGTVTGTAIYKNNTSQTVTVSQWAIAGRPPGGTNEGGPYLDFPYANSMTLAPGQEYTLQSTRTFASSDPTGIWYVFTTYAVNGVWYDSPSAYNVSLGVGVTVSPTIVPSIGVTPLPTAPPGESIIPNAPAWFSQATENIKGFLEQLYLTVVIWQRDSNFCHLLQGIADNSELTGCKTLTL